MELAAPRDYTMGGLPGDRRARNAAQRAFVELKLSYLQALEEIGDTEWLRGQVLGAEEPVDLWLLRAPVFTALIGVDAERRGRRQMLRRSLDSMFGELQPASGFAPL